MIERHYTGFSTKHAIATTACGILFILCVSACKDSDSSSVSDPAAPAENTATKASDLSLNEVFSNLNDQLDRASDNVQEAVAPHTERLHAKTKEEVQKLFQWEYKVVDVPATTSASSMEARLNELGEEGWECDSAQNSVSVIRVSCKRKPPSALAYLKYIPGL